MNIMIFAIEWKEKGERKGKKLASKDTKEE